AAIAPLVCLAQTQDFEFLPEADLYLKANSNLRIWLQAKDTREAGEQASAEIGPSIDIYFNKIHLLPNVQDDSKGRFMVLTAGYRYLPSTSGAPTNRMRLELTFHHGAPWKMLISDRNRADLDWKSGVFTWRYRNRLTVERQFAIRSYQITPYVSDEPFYESQYAKWSTNAFYAGCLFPVTKHGELNPYYEHQNNTGKAPNQQLNQVGLMLNLYFGLPK